MITPDGVRQRSLAGRLAWEIHCGDGAVFVALAVGLGATLWSLGNERGKREARTIR